MNWYVLAYGFKTEIPTIFDAYTDEYLKAEDIWESIERARTKEARERQLYMAALAPELPPTGMATGKTVVPRARRNLPQGVRNRFGKEEGA